MKANAEAKSLKPIGKPAALALANLVPSPGNRAIPKDDELKGLASSIRTVGLLYPIIVKLDPDQEDVYRIVAGERRWRAMKMLKLEFAPCVVLSDKDDEAQAEIVRVVENHQRRNLEPLEEAAAVRGLLDIGLEPEAVARSLGRSRAWVARRASLTELSERWLEECRNPQGKVATWPPSHLEVISRFPADVQDRILDQWRQNWQWSVPGFRDLVELTGQFLQVLSAAPWKHDDESLCAEAGACCVCPKRSSHTPDLFEGELDATDGKLAAGDRCLDAKCWTLKAEIFLSRKAVELRREHPELVLLNNGNDSRDDGTDLEETFQTEVLNASDVATSRKSDGNAVPALVVNGPGMGRIKWVQPVHSISRATTETNGASATGTAPVEKTPEEKRKPYDKRRRQIVIDAVKAKLEAIAAETDRTKAAEHEGGPELTAKGLLVKTLALLAKLLSDRGWRSQIYDGSAALPEAFVWDDLSSLKNHETGTGETREAVLALCWTLLRMAVSKLSSRLNVAPGEINNQPHYDEAETLCTMLGFNLEGLRAEAAVTIPYAKAWRDQVEDEWAGTKPETSEGAEVVAVNGSES